MSGEVVSSSQLGMHVPLATRVFGDEGSDFAKNRQATRVISLNSQNQTTVGRATQWATPLGASISAGTGQSLINFQAGAPTVQPVEQR